MHTSIICNSHAPLITVLFSMFSCHVFLPRHARHDAIVTGASPMENLGSVWPHKLVGQHTLIVFGILDSCSVWMPWKKIIWLQFWANFYWYRFISYRIWGLHLHVQNMGVTLTCAEYGGYTYMCRILCFTLWHGIKKQFTFQLLISHFN